MKNLKTFNEVNESLGGRDISSIDRIKKKYPKGIEIPKVITARGTENFPLGVDTLDPESRKFIEILETINDLLQNSKGKINVKISSGASAVGQGKYDNQALAERRRDNTIKALKSYQFIDPDRINFIPGDSVVGKATVKGSPEANKEQFVTAEISGTGELNVPVVGVQGDNTNVYRPELFRSGGKKRGEDLDFNKTKIKRICLQLPETYVNSFIDVIEEFRKNNGLKSIPYGIYDVIPKK